jgi:hypothetical protein
LDDIAPIVIPENPPWLNPKPTFNFELAQHKKSETNPLLIQQHFAEIRSVTFVLFSEEATNFKVRSIALASALKIELADGIRAE